MRSRAHRSQIPWLILYEFWHQLSKSTSLLDDAVMHVLALWEIPYVLA
jgi:hypothetical protein